MAKILVYNRNSNRMETYYRGLSEAMPYITNRTLTVREFRSNSSSNILWTSRDTMISWNNFRSLYGRGIYVGFAFKRPWEGGHANQSQHYAGTAFDVGQNLSSAGRTAMRNLAASSGFWGYVELVTHVFKKIQLLRKTFLLNTLRKNLSLEVNILRSLENIN